MPPVKVTMLLCDAAEAVGGKLYILGGGWSMTNPITAHSAIAIYIQVPWDQTNFGHRFRLELLDADGQPVLGGEEKPVMVEGNFEVGRPAGLKPGTPIDVPLALNVGPMRLPPDSRFEWRLTLDGETGDTWRLPFGTRKAPTGQQ
jgi:hypothetical protein